MLHKYIKDKLGNIVSPITSLNSVKDLEGNSGTTIISRIYDELNSLRRIANSHSDYEIEITLYILERMQELENSLSSLIPSNISRFNNDVGYLTEHQSLDDYATKDEINEAGYLTEHLSLDNYYTKQEVDSAIGNIQSLDNYYTKLEIDSTIDNITSLIELAINPGSDTNLNFVIISQSEYESLETKDPNKIYFIIQDLESTSSEWHLGDGLPIILMGEQLSEEPIEPEPIEPEPIDYSLLYLTIVSLSDNNTIGWRASNSNLTKTISVSTDNGATWTEKTSSTSVVTLATLNTGDKLLIKGSNTAYSNLSSYYNCFISTGQFNAEGNIMSLIYGDNFIGQIILSENYTFGGLFYNCNKLVSAENLILPATTLTEFCYQYMFTSCTSLVKAPELPAMILADSCYYNMFYGCILLVKAPELPAMTLTDSCYSGMFRACTSLVKAPELPAMTLANECYYGMFNSCTSLTTASELPATTLVSGCYYRMFKNCTSLKYIKCLATDISASNCISDWVSDVAATGTFIKANNMSSWTIGDNGIPSGWTVEDN